MKSLDLSRYALRSCAALRHYWQGAADRSRRRCRLAARKNISTVVVRRPQRAHITYSIISRAAKAANRRRVT
jgi:hypothetical protein